MGLIYSNTAKKKKPKPFFSLSKFFFPGLDGHGQRMPVHVLSPPCSPLSLNRTVLFPDLVLCGNKTFPGRSASWRHLSVTTLPTPASSVWCRSSCSHLCQQAQKYFNDNYFLNPLWVWFLIYGIFTPGVAECFLSCIYKCIVFSTAWSLCKLIPKQVGNDL